MKIFTWMPLIGMVLLLHIAGGTLAQISCLTLVDSGFVDNPGFESQSTDCQGCRFLSCSYWKGEGRIHNLSCCRETDNCYPTVPEGQIAASAGYHENATFGLKGYLGNCLLKPLLVGSKYQVKTFINFRAQANHDHTIDSLSFSIFGSTRCDSFTIPTPSVGISLADCPTLSNGTWEILASFKVPARIDEWMDLEVWFDHDMGQEIQAIYFGPSCRSVLGVDFTLKEIDLKYGLDHFRIYEYREEYHSIAAPKIQYCENKVNAPRSDFDSIIWYINGFARDHGQVQELDLTSLVPGDQLFVKIFDQNSCYESDTLEVLLTDTSQILQITTLSDASCQKNGVISIHVFPEDFAVDTIITPSMVEFASVPPGMYSVTVDNGQGCSFTRNAEVKLDSGWISIDLGPDLYMCAGDQIPIFDLLGNGPLNWSTGDVSDTLFIKNSASIVASHTMENCETSDTIEIFKEEFQFNPPVVEICPGDSALITLDSAASVVWYDGDTSKSKVINIPGNYSINVIGNFCVAEYMAQVLHAEDCIMQEKVTKIFPNIFTPNLDGANDLFKAYEAFEEVSFHIFNRWGDLMYFSNQSIPEWNGETKGDPAPAGVYMYIFKGKQLSGKSVNEVGTVTLVR